MNNHRCHACGRKYSRTVRTDGLSVRQWECVRYIQDGLTNAEIAEKLFISIRTVREHITTINKILGTSNRNEIINKTARKLPGHIVKETNSCDNKGIES